MPNNTKYTLSDFIREYRDRGLLLLFQNLELLHELVLMISRSIGDSLDFSKGELINRSIIPASLHKVETDLLCRLPLRNSDRKATVCLLLENQTEPERDMPLRIHGYTSKIWDREMLEMKDRGVPPAEQKLSVIIPIVLYTGESEWKFGLHLLDMMDAPDDMKHFVSNPDLLFLSLRDLDESELSGSGLRVALRTLRSVKAPFGEFAPILEKAFQELQTFPIANHGEFERLFLFLLMLVYHGRPAEEKKILYNIMNETKASIEKREGFTMSMTIAEELILEGKLEGERAILLKLGTERFGEPGAEIADQIFSITDSAKLETIIGHFLQANSWSSLIRDN